MDFVDVLYSDTVTDYIVVSLVFRCGNLQSLTLMISIAHKKTDIHSNIEEQHLCIPQFKTRQTNLNYSIPFLQTFEELSVPED